MATRTARHFTTTEKARLLVKLAARAKRESKKLRGLRALAEALPEELAALGPMHYKSIEVLLAAREVFKGKLESLLIRFGVARVKWLAKLKAAEHLAAGGKVKLPNGDERTLAELSSSELDTLLRHLPHRRGGRRLSKSRAPANPPGALFAIPRDLAAIRRAIFDRLKSLRIPGTHGHLRFKVTIAKKTAKPLEVKEVIEEASQLKEMLVLLLDLVDQLADGKAYHAHLALDPVPPRERADGKFDYVGRVTGGYLIDGFSKLERPTMARKQASPRRPNK